MARNTRGSKKVREGSNPSAFLKTANLSFLRPEKLKLDVLRYLACLPKSHFSFSTGELVMLLCIAGHAWELLKYCTFQTIPRMKSWWEGEVFSLGRAFLFVGLLLLAFHASLLPFQLLGKNMKNYVSQSCPAAAGSQWWAPCKTINSMA